MSLSTKWCKVEKGPADEKYLNQSPPAPVEARPNRENDGAEDRMIRLTTPPRTARDIAARTMTRLPTE